MKHQEIKARKEEAQTCPEQPQSSSFDRRGGYLRN